MAKYCIYCDRPIIDGKPCPCRNTSQQGTAKQAASFHNREKSAEGREGNTGTSTGSSTGSGTRSASYHGHNRHQNKRSEKGQKTQGQAHQKAWTHLFHRAKTVWTTYKFTQKALNVWQNLAKFAYRPSHITTQLDEVKPSSPILIMLGQIFILYLWALNFLHNTNLGHFLRYTEKTYLESSRSYTSRIAFNIVIILVIAHLAKLVFTYLCLRIQHYHVSWKQAYLLSLPANIIATLSILISFLFLYGSGFIALGILFFSCIAASGLDYLTLKNKFKFSSDKALFFTWILYLMTAIAIAGTVELIFPHISFFYMNTGISF